ncbi:DUF6182 family protein [Streptomyces shenzhenensis]|uniref:DUF6182 family protein n=1 Tax=Streptomyces shenzhenensis TaxID=943815 RepID=UPI0036CE54AE
MTGQTGSTAPPGSDPALPDIDGPGADIQDIDLPDAEDPDGSLQTLLQTSAAARLARLNDQPGHHFHTAAVVVDTLTPQSFVRGVLGFALSLPEQPADAWLRTFTRTIFLAGRPATVAARFPDGYATPDNALSWYGPVPTVHLKSLSRLLRAFAGPAPAPAPEPFTVRLPGPDTGFRAEAVVATADLTVADYLVHSHHLFAEAALRGLVRPGDTVHVTHRPAFDAPRLRDALDPARADRVETRITHDTAAPELLRLYGALFSDRTGGKACAPNAS